MQEIKLSHFSVCSEVHDSHLVLASFHAFFSECNCDPDGARDNFCDILTGNCLCKNDITGRACDQCDRGMWNFPNCQRCQCNGHADICDDATGDCIQCRDDTTGPSCGVCIDGKTTIKYACIYLWNDNGSTTTAQLTINFVNTKRKNLFK